MKMTDATTGLPMKAAVRHALDEAIARDCARRRPLAVALVAINGFRALAAHLGRPAADEILRETAQRLQARVRRSDVVAYWKRGRFVVLLDGVGTREAAAGAESLQTCFLRPFLANGKETWARASIGMAVYPADGNWTDELIESAEAALREARRAGSNHSAFEDRHETAWRHMPDVRSRGDSGGQMTALPEPPPGA
jgi:diguanylate cyclase (GGDEF)-like protein